MAEPLCSVLVPYRPDGGHRDAAWAWIEQRWATLLPECEVIVSSDDGGASPAQFNHPAAINRCAERAASDVLIVADADTAFEPQWVRDAVDWVRFGVSPYVMPTFYDKLTEAQTATVLGMPCDAVIPADLDLEWRGESVANSGLVVIPRAGFDLIGGYEERISWYGADDVVARVCLDVLWGPVFRMNGRCLHLHHPQPPEHAHGHGENDRQQALVAEYTAAADSADPVAAVRAVRFGV